MLKLVQAGQIGATNLLIEMHRFRKRVFCDRLSWEVSISESGLEIDQFDIPEALYLLATEGERVIGAIRLLSAAGPTMIRDVWPDFLNSVFLPNSPKIWEGSRFAVEKSNSLSGQGLTAVNKVTQQLFYGLTELCLHCCIREVFTLYDARIARLVKRIGCHPVETSDRLTINGIEVEVGRYITDYRMLTSLQRHSGISGPLIDVQDIPSLLTNSLRNKESYLSCDWFFYPTQEHGVHVNE